MANRRIPYSSKVVLRLAISGQIISLAQVGPDFVVLRDIPKAGIVSCDARVDIIVDNRVTSSQTVFLPHGISNGSKLVTYF
jgi:hypothetical protein